MAKAINQNDLVDIIKSHVDALNDISNIIIKSDFAQNKDNIKLVSARLEDMKTFLDVVFGEKGLISIINTISKSIDSFEKIGWRKMWKFKGVLKSVFKLMYQLIKYSLRIGVYWASMPLIMAAMSFTMIVLSEFAVILKTLDYIKDINIKAITRKLKRSGKILKALYSKGRFSGGGGFLQNLQVFANNVNNNVDMKLIMIVLAKITIIMVEFANIMLIISKTKSVWIIPQLWMMKKNVKKLQSFMVVLSEVVTYISENVDTKKIMIYLLVIITIMYLLKILFAVVVGLIGISLLIFTFAWIINLAVRAVFGTMRLIIKMSDKIDNKKATEAFLKLAMLIGKYIAVAIAFLPLIPIAAQITAGGMDLILSIPYITALIIGVLINTAIIVFCFEKVLKKYQDKLTTAMVQFELAVLKFVAVVIALNGLTPVAKELSEGFGDLIEVFKNTPILMFGLYLSISVMVFIYEKLLKKHQDKLLQALVQFELAVVKFIALSSSFLPLIPIAKELSEGFKDLVEVFINTPMLLFGLYVVSMVIMYAYEKLLKKHQNDITKSLIQFELLITKYSTLLIALKSLIDPSKALNVGFSDILYSLFAVPLLLMALITVCHIFVFIDQKLLKRHKKRIESALISMGVIIAAFTVLAGAMIALIIAVQPIADKWKDAYLFLLGLLVFILITIMVMYVVAKITSKLQKYAVIGLWNIIKLLGLLLIISITLLLLLPISLALQDGFMEILKLLLFIVVAAAIITVIGIMISFASPYLSASIAAFGVLALTVLAILVIAALLKILEAIELNEDKIAENVAKISGLMGVVIAAIFNSLAASAVPDSAESNNWGYKFIAAIGGVIQLFLGMTAVLMTLVAVFCLVLIGAAFMVIEQMHFDEGKVKQNIKKIMDTAKYIILCLFGNEDETEEQKSEKGFFESVLDWFSGFFSTLGAVIGAVLAVAFLALTLVSVGLLVLIGLALLAIEQFNIDDNKVNENAKKIIEVAKGVINCIFYNNDETEGQPSKKGFFESVLDWFSGFFSTLGMIIKAIMAVAFLALVLVSVGLLMLIGMALQKIAEITFEKETVDKKAAEIISTAKGVVKIINKPVEVNETEEKKGWLAGLLDAVVPDSLKSMLEALNALGTVGILYGVCGMLAGLAESLVKIKDLPEMNGIETKADTIINVAQNIVKKLSADQDWDEETCEDKVGVLDDLLDVINDFVSDTDHQKFESLTNNYVKFMDKINSTNLVKLQTAERLFKNMAEFSKSIRGNFDALADALNEKIAPLLEKLDKGIQDLNNDVNDNSKKQLQATTEGNLANASSDTLKNAAGGDKGKLDKLTAQQKAAQDKDKKKYQGMQDIMDILLGQSGYKGVKITSK